MNFGDGLTNRFSPASYKRIVNDIKSKNMTSKTQGLENLAETLAFADPSQLRNFPMKETCREIVKIFQNSNDHTILTLTTQCIINILDAITESQKVITNSNYIQIVKEKIQYKLLSNISTIENIIHSLCILSKYRSKEISNIIIFKFILDNINLISTPEKHHAAIGLSKLTSSGVSTIFSKYLPQIFHYFSLNDSIISNNMIDTFTNILNSVSYSDIPIETTEVISKVTPSIEDPDILIRVLTLIQRLTYFQKFSESLIDHKFDFGKILFENEYDGSYLQIRRLVLLIIRSFLPVPDFPIGFWENDRAVPSNTEQFCEYIQNDLFELASEKLGDYDLIFVCLAMTLQLHPIDVPPILLPLMTAISQDPKISPFVLLLALNIPDKQKLCNSGLISQLSLIQIEDPTINSWYKQKLVVLKSFETNPLTNRPNPSEFKNFSEIYHFFNETKLSSFELHVSGYTNRLLKLLKEETDIGQYDFTLIIEKLHQIITYMTIPEFIDPFESMSTNELASGMILVDIKFNGKLFNHRKFENTSLMIAIEAWYNETALHVTTNDLLNAARHSKKLGQLISLENMDKVSYTHIGLLHRAFGTRRYKRFSFKIDGKKYTAFDFMFQSIARNLPNPEYWPLIATEIEMVDQEDDKELNADGENEVMTPIVVPDDKIPNKLIFEILETIHKLQPSVDLCCAEFERTLHPHLMSFFLDVGLFSPAVQIAYHFQFLFSFEFRTFVFRMICSDFFSALSYAQKMIFNIPEKLRTRRIFNHCKVHRNSLFEDGFTLLNKVASGPLQLDINFDKEAGFGIGPTKEFLSLFSEELTKKKYKMWRCDDDTNGSEFAWSKIGLFPRCDSDPQLFYVFGVLCAKAINMNTVLPIPLSVEFFKLIRGEEIKLNEIDPILSHSLTCKEGLVGLNFVLPNNDSESEPIELIENGQKIEVTIENVDEYVKLVEDFICGDKLQFIKERFCSGFSTVFQGGLWNLFEAREWRRLVSGEDVQLTLKDLNKYVEISHGYEKDSPQISMLFEVLTEFDNDQKSLFVKFITGSERLPIGGLASLQPKLAIAKRIDESVQNPDDSLPSVMTCTNYFKLPPYSSKVTMKEKILKAITEGQGAFLLT